MAKEPERLLRMEVREVGEATVVKIRGSAGMNEAEELRIKLDDIVRRRPATIILDLGEMDFISSAGLGAIISCHLRCRHHRGQIRLVAPQPAVRQLLETTRLTELFGLFATVEEALED